MNILKHITHEPFITATGVAALIHSTWALGTIFSGEQPAVENISSWIEFIHFVGWLMPALLIAFALDIGQISTSTKIRNNGFTPQLGITFFVFSGATFFLQWFYMMHHIPLVSVGAGVSEMYQPIVVFMRDTGLFIVPALLPTATLLYTFSGRNDAKPAVVSHAAVVTVEHNPAVEIVSDNHLALESDTQDLQPVAQLVEAITYSADCDCGWNKTYANEASAARALRTHQQMHCVNRKPVASSNGTHA